MRKKRIVTVCGLAAAGLLLITGISAGKALAYFTTYASAGGRVQLALGFTQTETNDDVRDWTKHISIQNTGDQACFVRVKVFAGEKYLDYLEYSQAGQNTWRLEDGYWYYDRILAPQETTEELLAALNRVKVEDSMEAEEFNVIVVQEYTPVLYDAEGNPYADWNLAVSGGESRDAEDGTGTGF